jgi:hypothetical protein
MRSKVALVSALALAAAPAAADGETIMVETCLGAMVPLDLPRDEAPGKDERACHSAATSCARPQQAKRRAL